MPDKEKDIEYSKDDGTDAIGEENENNRAQFQKVKEALKVCERERKEYLNGWKRAKADALNERKRQADGIERERLAVLGKCVMATLPVSDAVSVAVSQKGGDIQKGVELIHAQCMKALQEMGSEVINPAIGDIFDPHQHQAVGSRSVSKEKDNNSIDAVERIGVKVKEMVIRPAMVYVGKYEESTK